MPLYRKVIKIKGEQSPNVRLALAQLRGGREPTGEMLVPGVLSWHDYQKRRTTWDKVKQTIGLDAEFYEGAELLLYPADWLDRAESLAASLRGRQRIAVAMGVDPAEGGDKTCFCVIDELGIIELLSYSTVDTSVIIPQTLALIRKHKLDPRRVCFDRGGGGMQLANELRRREYGVKTVAFGEAVRPEMTDGVKTLRERRGDQEEQYPYRSRRVEMYAELRERLRPAWFEDNVKSPLARHLGGQGFGLPQFYTELRRQLALFPLLYDNDGRMYLPAKTRKSRNKLSEKTLEEIIGHSPDEADALVIALYALRASVRRGKAGAAW